jgi:hypothetical protein
VGTSGSRSRALTEFGGPLRYAAIAFLVSLALLNSQVTVTRLLAYRFFYHYVFFVISLAQLGLAAAGAWVYASRRRSWTRRDLSDWILGLGILPLAILTYYGWLSPQANLSLAKVDGPPAYFHLAGIAVLLVALNFCGGMVLTLLFTTFRARIGHLYAADLAGAAMGCLGSVAVMVAAGPIRAFLMTGVAAGCCALLLVPRGGRDRFLLGGALALLAILGAAALLPRLFDPDLFHPEAAGRIQRTEWNHLARVDALRPGLYVIDGDASTDVVGFRDSLKSMEYMLTKAQPQVAIIGVGAGPQLITALQHDAASVLAVDINPTIIRWSRGFDHAANGNVFHDPRVDVVVGEGRHALRSSERDFDLIVMHAIDTYTASAQGAYSLTENFLYTTEAMSDVLAKLRPGGIASVRRWLFWPPRENLRLFTTTFDALERAGFEEPERHVVVLSPDADYRGLSRRIWGSLLFSNRPFTDEQLTLLDGQAAERGWGFLYRPGASLDTPFHEFVAAEDRLEFCRSYPYVVTPARDSNPFFFQFTPPWSAWLGDRHITGNVYQGSSTVLLLCLLLAVALTVLLLGVPLFLRRGDLSRDTNRLSSIVYFGCLGLGFMAFELPAIQVMTLFLGHPTYALSVVLLGLLAAAGVGSALMGRLRVGTGSPVLIGIVALAVGSALGLLPAVHGLIELPDPARFAVTLGYLVLIGVPLGMPFVAGVRLLHPDRPHQVAWAWAVNGATAVVGTCVLMILMVYSGSRAAFLVAALCYAVAFVVRPGLTGRGR